MNFRMELEAWSPEWETVPAHELDKLPPYLRKWAKENRPKREVPITLSSTFVDEGDFDDEDAARMKALDHIAVVQYADCRPSIVNNFTNAYYDKDTGEMVRVARSRKVREVSQAPKRQLERRDFYVQAAEDYLMDEGTAQVEPKYKALQFKLREMRKKINAARSDEERDKLEGICRRWISEFYVWIVETNLGIARKHKGNEWDREFLVLDYMKVKAQESHVWDEYKAAARELLERFEREVGIVAGWLPRPEHLSVAPTTRR